LLYSGEHFAQLIEGEAEAIASTMAAIERDRRHEGLRRLIDGPAEKRRFGAWHMAYVDAPGAEELLSQLLGGPTVAAARAEQLLDLLLGAAAAPD
jgi:hypothetical protein